MDSTSTATLESSNGANCFMIGVKIREPVTITILRHYSFNLKLSKTQTILACNALYDGLFRLSPFPHEAEIVVVDVLSFRER